MMQVDQLSAGFKRKKKTLLNPSSTKGDTQDLIAGAQYAYCRV